MPQFSSPFSGTEYKRKLSKAELVRAIRFSIAAEFEAIQIYEQLSDSIDDNNAKKLLAEIVDDEKVHVGNFMKLLYFLEPVEKEFYKEGIQEAVDLLGLENTNGK